MYGPKFYNSIEEFEREEILPHTKAGWSLDDIFTDATYKVQDDTLDDALDELKKGY